MSRIKRFLIFKEMKYFKTKHLDLIIILILFCFTLCHLLLDLRFLCREDGFVENMSAFFWAAGSAFALFIILQKSYSRKIIVFICLAVCIVALGEEISWGQRIFHFQTPDFIAQANRQSEFNFHNLTVLSGGSTWRNFFKTGNFDYHQIIDAQNLFRIGFLTFFFIFPLLYNTKPGMKILSHIGYYKPDLRFTVIVLIYIVFSFLIIIGQELSFSRTIQEIREMSYALIMAMYLCKFYFHIKMHHDINQMI